MMKPDEGTAEVSTCGCELLRSAGSPCRYLIDEPAADFAKGVEDARSELSQAKDC